MKPFVPFVEELKPVPDPWRIARTFAGWPHLLFLDSSDRHSKRGRFSFVSAEPKEWTEIGQVELGRADPFAQLDQLLARYPAETISGLPPFQGGLAGLFGYGLAHSIERLPRPKYDEFQTPDLAVGLYDWVIAFDHVQGRAWIIAREWKRLEQLLRIVQFERMADSFDPARARPSVKIEAPQFPLPGHAGVTSNFDRSGYLAAVGKAIEYINAGDCFQVNVAQRLLAPLTQPRLELYRKLRELNPAPFGGFFDLGEFAVASASPERFLRVDKRLVESRPIKGTRPRGGTLGEDEARRVELSKSAKDRAENVMIVDLLRNDLGRVCEFGSIRVPVVCEVESFRFVHHLVSVVAGKLRADKSPLDLLRAAFPGGSVTGAPKVRSMEIISELEPTARGPYCGSLGYIGFDGSMDANILIRTFTVGKGWVQFPVGGGIVADSDPQREFEETLHKAVGLLGALETNAECGMRNETPKEGFSEGR